MEDTIIYKNDLIRIEIENSEIPWLKIFTQEPHKEFSQCPKDTKLQIWSALDIIEKEMLSYFSPEKINIASFGNSRTLLESRQNNKHKHFHYPTHDCF